MTAYHKIRSIELTGGFLLGVKLELDETHRATKWLAKWVAEQSLPRTSAVLARQCGFDERSVRCIFTRHVDHLEKTVAFVIARHFGIDEVHSSGGCGKSLWASKDTR